MNEISSAGLKVAYVGPVPFPSGRADAQRMLGVAQSLVRSGMQVMIGSGSTHEGATRVYSAYGLEIVRMSEMPDSDWPKLRRVAQGLVWGSRTRDWLSRPENRPDVIVLYGTPIGYVIRLRRLARRLRIPFVIDAVEWHDSSHLPGGRFGPFALANHLSMRLLARRADGAIVISRFLARHFERYGIPTVRVPPLFDLPPPASTSSPNPSSDDDDDDDDEIVRLCYVGSPGAKDRVSLVNLFQVTAVLAELGPRISIDIVGITRAEGLSVATAAGVETDPGIHFHGRVSAEEARVIVQRSNYSVLQRPDERFAQAGFPSKVAESLLLGTPILGNLTSDLAEYLVEGVNAEILPDATLESLATAIRKILASSERLDKAAIARGATESFSPNAHASSLAAFMKRLTQPGVS